MALYRRKRSLWIVISNHFILLDVSEDDVMEDYLKTNKAAITRVEKLKKKLHLAGLHREKSKNRGLFCGKRRIFKCST